MVAGLYHWQGGAKPATVRHRGRGAGGAPREGEGMGFSAFLALYIKSRKFLFFSESPPPRCRADIQPLFSLVLMDMSSRNRCPKRSLVYKRPA